MRIRTLAVFLVASFLLATGVVPLLASSILYNNLPTPIPPNSPSLGYQANQTAEFGDLIQLSGGAANLTSATLLMSDWALASSFPAMGPDPWAWPLTLTLYNIDNSSGTPQPGSVIDTVTQTFAIPWRPEADPTCPNGGTAYRAGDGNCYNGINFQVTFNLPSDLVPGQFIFGLSYNTETWGKNPTGVTGPYDSLNYSLITAPPQVGSRPFPDTAYWNTMTAADYTDGGLGGTGTFRQDTNWTYSAAAEFSGTSVPEPGTFGFMCCGVIMIGGLVRRKCMQ